MSLPGATQTLQWGDDLVFKIGGKMFVVLPLEPSAPTKLSFKCSPDKFYELTERPDIIPAPYLARAQWVALERLEALSRAELEELLRESYELVCAKLPKKMQEQVRNPSRTKVAATTKGERRTRPKRRP
ncbi:MAG TPA: MmcQ/YjbR family DNA-binding protein [Terriglobales bacterium]|nr:MmcQ/YjbR family DNA-binding protein [Terriglobales bacterium]